MAKDRGKRFLLVHFFDSERAAVPYRPLFLHFIAGWSTLLGAFLSFAVIITIVMKKCIKLKLVLQLDCEKTKQTKVAPYVRFRNGKKELVKGYVRKNREL